MDPRGQRHPLGGILLCKAVGISHFNFLPVMTVSIPILAPTSGHHQFLHQFLTRPDMIFGMLNHNRIIQVSARLCKLVATLCLCSLRPPSTSTVLCPF